MPRVPDGLKKMEPRIVQAMLNRFDLPHAAIVARAAGLGRVL